ncbi:MAG: hypothetical protein SNF33_00650 [Candidatus Algichlamydia australiensis]|nr:hypothetical protein [Chlamydiales bacterium]
MSQNQKAKTLAELEDVIAKAIKKVGGNKENDLCKYIPMDSGGYIHHFTLRKMKSKDPSELLDLIKNHIIKADRPRIVAPKQRAPRGSRKRRDQITFTKGQLERLLNLARLSGDKEMISILSPKKSLAAAKRELIQAVRHGVVKQEYWDNYVESVNAHEMVAQATAMEYSGLSSTE